MKVNSPQSEKFVSESFESDFMQVPLEIQIEQWDRYELGPLFKRWLPQYEPIPKAGCGSGRWVAWFLNQEWTTAVLDWSEALCARARAAVPNGRFEAGDIRSMPFEDNEFGSIGSLGAIEHTIEGPYDSLRNYARVLRPDGIAIITVSYGSIVRKNMMDNFILTISSQDEFYSKTIWQEGFRAHNLYGSKDKNC